MRERDQAWGRRASIAAVLGVPVAIVSVVVSVLALTGGGGPKAGSPRPHLKVVDLTVVNNNDPYKPGPKPRIDITVHNVGTARIVLKRARIAILAVTPLSLCTSQGDLPVSNDYSVLLPSQPGTVDVPLHQQLGADKADRFTLALGATGQSFESAVLLYRLRLSIRSDDGTQVNAGTALATVSIVPDAGEYFWPKEFESKTAAQVAALTNGAIPADYEYARTMPCWRTNTERLRAFLSLPGARSPELAAVAGQLARHIAVPAGA